jgi:hypothetical protein
VLGLPNSLFAAAYSSTTINTTAFGARGWEHLRGPRTTLGGQLAVRDLQSGDARTLVTFEFTHAVTQVVAGEDRVAWVESWRDSPSPSAGLLGTCLDTGKPLRWRIAMYQPVTNTQTTVATGTNTRLVYGGTCADIRPPVIDLDGDRLAYSVEAGTSAAPLAQKVIIRAITPGQEVASYAATGSVEELRLSGDAVAWRENAEAAAGSLVLGRGRLILVKGAGAAPLLIEAHAGALGLSGKRIAWVAAGSTPQAVWTAAIDTGQGFAIPMQLASAITAADVAFVTAGESMVAWGQNVKTPSGCCASLLALWANGEPVARTVEGFGGPVAAWIKGGWLVWTTRHATTAWHDDPKRPDGFQAVRLEAIAPPWQ